MIDDYECNVIVMLCRDKENGTEKCAKYWDEKYKMEKYIIKIKSEEKKETYIIREIILYNNSSKKQRKIQQIHFIAWPDHGVPNIEGGKIFDTFIEIINEVDEFRGNNPIVVHCSAGVGRTGTFISMYSLYKEIKNQIDNKEKEIQFNIFNLVRKIKEMRILMVQTEVQFQFIHYFVRHLLSKLNK
jgi:protein tyrosine phosphatase